MRSQFAYQLDNGDYVLITLGSTGTRWEYTLYDDEIFRTDSGTFDEALTPRQVLKKAAAKDGAAGSVREVDPGALIKSAENDGGGNIPNYKGDTSDEDMLPKSMQTKKEFIPVNPKPETHYVFNGFSQEPEKPKVVAPKEIPKEEKPEEHKGLVRVLLAKPEDKPKESEDKTGIVHVLRTPAKLEEKPKTEPKRNTEEQETPQKKEDAMDQALLQSLPSWTPNDEYISEDSSEEKSLNETIRDFSKKWKVKGITRNGPAINLESVGFTGETLRGSYSRAMKTVHLYSSNGEKYQVTLKDVINVQNNKEILNPEINPGLSLRRFHKDVMNLEAAYVKFEKDAEDSLNGNAVITFIEEAAKKAGLVAKFAVYDPKNPKEGLVLQVYGEQIRAKDGARLAWVLPDGRVENFMKRVMAIRFYTIFEILKNLPDKVHSESGKITADSLKEKMNHFVDLAEKNGFGEEHIEDGLARFSRFSL